MKKFLLFLILLAILGGAGFFLGWAQLTVPPGSYGVMRSKTHGLESRIIHEGEFRWIWYKLIPTNVKISVFTINPLTRSIRSSGSLGSGDVYASLAGLEADFSWEISCELSFSLNPAHLPELIVKENIADDAGLRQAEEKLAQRIESFTIQRLKAYAESDEEKIDSIIPGASLPDLNSAILAAFPEIENVNCALATVRFPDYDLYRSVRALYREYLARQNAVLSPEIGREAENRVNTKLRLEELAQYGELLTKYPILLQYLALEKGVLPAAPNTPPEDPPR